MKPETNKVRFTAVAVLFLSWAALANVPQESGAAYAIDPTADRVADRGSTDARYANQDALQQGLLLPSRFDSEHGTQVAVGSIKSATEIVEAAQARAMIMSRPRAYWLVWIASLWALLALLSCGWSLREAAEQRHST
jgi:hypothetical protein